MQRDRERLTGYRRCECGGYWVLGDDSRFDDFRGTCPYGLEPDQIGWQHLTFPRNRVSIAELGNDPEAWELAQRDFERWIQERLEAADNTDDGEERNVDQ